MGDPDKGDLTVNETEIVDTTMDKNALDKMCTKMTNLRGEFLKHSLYGTDERLRCV